MKIIQGIKIGGLQQKIFNLMLFFILLLIGIYTGVAVWQQHNLTNIVQDTGRQQQDSIAAISEETMETVIDLTVSNSTALQAYIADDLFSDVRSDVVTLQAIATELFQNGGSYAAQPFYPPDAANDGISSVQMQHEEGVDPASSADLGLAANMSEIMLAMFESSEKLSSCFVATADGCILFVDDRAGAYVDESGTALPFDVRKRTWYRQAAGAGTLIFTGVEEDAFTGIPGIVCAAPVYRDGTLAAVVGADIFLDSVSEYVKNTASEGGFVCVVGADGKVLFSPETEGVFAVGLSSETSDLRENENRELAAFVSRALMEDTGVQQIPIGEKLYYMSGAPLDTVGWAVLSVTDKEVTDRPALAMIAQYSEINDGAIDAYETATRQMLRLIIILTVCLVLAAVTGALVLAHRIVRPLEVMTGRINAIRGSDAVFSMEDDYRTDDEIEILAESFATLSRRTRDYISEITRITAEKERIGAELSLATRIQSDMLPSLFPAFPDRPEFDIYASMTPAREVGGDFYDFFLTDNNHLCMVMADVSGKGVPAALFMMASKIMLANQAMTGKSPAKILEDTNAAICANNREEMFVTVWIGILEISTGLLTAANAGHEYPVLFTPGGEFAVVKDAHGFVIGGMEGMKYQEYELQLLPGAKLFLYTDGVPEAADGQGEMFGTERMLSALNADSSASPEKLLELVSTAVKDFVKETEQFDDLTMLALEYEGRP